jgi:hypothetical protein
MPEVLFRGQGRPPGYIKTHHNLAITVRDIRREMLRPHDIAWHLSRTCRYNALMGMWYSNAEHSVLGLKLIDDWEGKRQFLMHDAGEMITGDVPYPVKALCPDYKKICDEVQAQVNQIFFGTPDFLPCVKEADYLITATEQRELRGQPDEDLMVEPLHGFKFECWPWEVAMVKWMDAFIKYYPEWRWNA